MKIGVVIVTYNRLEKLKKALDSYEKQILLPSYILVVDNASTDGTKQYLDNWSKIREKYEKIVIIKQENSGGSGGFYTGLSEAIKKDAEWIWISDDDAYPQRDALVEAYSFLSRCKDKNILSICGAVYCGNKIDTSHRRRIMNKIVQVNDKAVDISEYKSTFELNAFSYVGTLICKRALKEVGLTNEQYFLHYDDTEHSLRISKIGKIICVPNIKVYHDINMEQDPNKKEYSWQKYYDYRNMLDMFRRHFPKRFYFFKLFILELKIIFPRLFNISKEYRELLIDALKDIKEHKLGMNPKYKPENIIK